MTVLSPWTEDIRNALNASLDSDFLHVLLEASGRVKITPEQDWRSSQSRSDLRMRDDTEKKKFDIKITSNYAPFVVVVSLS